MYILEVSYGCPNNKYPLNGIFQMDQAKALASIGHKIVFVAIDVRSIRKWRKWGLTHRQEEAIDIVEFNFPVGPVFGRLRALISKSGFSMAYHYIRKQIGKPDIVHVHFGGTATSVVDVCKKEKVPFAITEHSSWLIRDGIAKKEIEKIRPAYTNASAVIAVSSSLAKKIEQYFQVKSIVIPNIIDFSLFQVKKDYHLGFRMLSAGNLNQRKGFDILLIAFKKCLERGMKATLTIMGNGPEREHLENIVSRLGIKDYVTFFGEYMRSEFVDELANSDIFVLPSRFETFGVVYAEALACGIPVIATRCGGPEDFVNEKRGILVEIDNIDELAEAMDRMYTSIDSFDKNEIALGVKRFFSAKVVASEIEKVFNIALEYNREGFAL